MSYSYKKPLVCKDLRELTDSELRFGLRSIVFAGRIEEHFHDCAKCLGRGERVRTPPMRKKAGAATYVAEAHTAHM